MSVDLMITNKQIVQQGMSVVAEGEKILYRGHEFQIKTVEKNRGTLDKIGQYLLKGISLGFAGDISGKKRFTAWVSTDDHKDIKGISYKNLNQCYYVNHIGTLEDLDQFVVKLEEKMVYFLSDFISNRRDELAKVSILGATEFLDKLEAIVEEEEMISIYENMQDADFQALSEPERNRLIEIHKGNLEIREAGYEDLIENSKISELEGMIQTDSQLRSFCNVLDSLDEDTFKEVFEKMSQSFFEDLYDRFSENVVNLFYDIQTKFEEK